MASSDESWKVRLDQALHQQNFFTDILAKLEEKSKVPRLFIVLGKVIVPPVCSVFLLFRQWMVVNERLRRA